MGTQTNQRNTNEYTKYKPMLKRYTILWNINVTKLAQSETCLR